MEGSGSCSACFLRKRGAAGQRARPLRHGLRRATSPKGRGLGIKMKFEWTAKGSPFGRAGALAPERARMLAWEQTPPVSLRSTAPSEMGPLAWRQSFRADRKACGCACSPGGSCRAATEGL